MQGPYYGSYGVSTAFQFVLYLADGTALQPSATLAAGDAKRVINGGTLTNTTNTIVNEGGGVYSLTLTAAEMTGERITIAISDQTATQTFLDTALHVVTVGNASANLEFNLNSAMSTQAVSSVIGNVGGNVVGSVGSIPTPTGRSVLTVDDTTVTPTTTTLAILEASPFSQDDSPIGRKLYFADGVNVGVETFILDWDDSEKTMIYRAIPAAPSDGDTIWIVEP